MIEDRAMERLLARGRDDEITIPRPRTDAEHRRVFGWAWDDPDEGGDLEILWGPPAVV